jgi:protein-S-isoprenylcysteine O-methyltransferase Ste14
MSALYIGFYFVCWAVFHSFLASLRAKRLAGRIFGEAAKRWYRLGFVIIAVLTLIPLLLLLLRLPDIPLYTVAPPWRWLMMAGQIAALGLLAWTIMSTEPLDFVGLRQIAGGRSPARSVLTTHGLYRISRHPMYFASMLVMWLSPSMSMNLLTLFALMSLYFIIGSYHEEMLLVKQFGTAYREYRKRVPRIFPGLPFPP